MKLKLDEKGNAVVSDGKPVYVYDDGKEVAFDAVGTRATIARLNEEAKANRERYESAESRLSAFAEIDPESAKKALSTVRNLDEKKLVDAGQRDEAVREAIKATEAKYTPVVKRVEALEQQLHQEKIGGGFARSKFIADKVFVPTNMVQATFGSQFKLEDGRVVGYDASGNKLFSRAKPGEPADFDEALEMIIEAYPDKDRILKGNNATGSGATGRPAMPNGEDLSSLPPAERLNAARRAAPQRIR